MAKDKISDYSSTANSNTDIAGINIDEGCAPSGINDAIRTLMAQLKNFQTGTGGDSFNGPVGSTTASTGAFTTLSASSTTTLSGGTANGVAYLNGSKVVTTGTALTFDGSNFAVTGGLITGTKGSSNGLTIGDVSTNSNALLRLQGTSAGYNFLLANNLNVGGFEITPSTATGGTTYSNPVYSVTGLGLHKWFNGTTQAMTLDASGNLGVGATSPSAKLHVTTGSTGVQALFSNSSGTPTVAIGNSTTTYNTQIGYNVSSEYGYIQAVAAAGVYDDIAINPNGGNLLVGTTSLQSAEKVSVANASATPQGIWCKYTGAAPNSTSAEFLLFNDTSTTRMTVRSNGGIANYSANNVNLSDERTKTDIQNAGSYLAKICAIPVRTFKYKDQTDDLLNLGCIAQEVEAVAPELVDVSGFGETPEDGVPLKAIYQTDLQYALMKALQELKAEFDAYKASHP